MPLRFVWGAQKGGTTGLWDMLHAHLACGSTTRFGRAVPSLHREEKESHYLVSVSPPSRAEYMGTYLLTECASHCFMDATPDNLIVPLAAARLRSMMSSAEAVRSRRLPCADRLHRLALQPHPLSHAAPSANAHVPPLHRRGRGSWCSFESPSLARCPSSR
jgi:hypothetical protein